MSEPPPALLGQPADKAQAVPTNVVLHYALPLSVVPLDDDPDNIVGDYKLITTDGEEVALHAKRSSKLQIELTPDAPLAPETSYTLEAHWKLRNGDQADAGLRFETGAGPAEETPEPPSAALLSYALPRQPSDTCGPRQVDSCISLQDDKSLIEYTIFGENGEAQAVSLLRGSTFIWNVPSAAASHGCIELRRFGASGTRSQPLRLCQEDAIVADVSNVVAEPHVYCSGAGLQWCDDAGNGGSEPGPGNTGDENDALHCADTTMLGAKASSQRAQPEMPVPDATAANGCSAAPVRGARKPSPLALFVCMLAWYARRRWQRQKLS